MTSSSAAFASLFRPNRCLLVLLGATLATIAACKKPPPPPEDPVFRVGMLGITLPKEAGWKPARSATTSPQGDVHFELVREDAVPGSPRIELRVQPPTTRTALEPFVTQNLRDIAALEDKKLLRIIHVNQERIQLAHGPAVQVRHEYTTGSGAHQVALVQVSLFFLYQGRGVALTAVGRNELFHPLAADIDKILHGVKWQGVPQSVPKAPAKPQSPVQPIDLGRIGESP